MNGIDFFNKVQEHPDLEWMGCCAEAGEVYIKCASARATLALPVSSILAYNWVDLGEVLTCKRESRVLNHLSRIVGYFSQTRNWNRSKLVELRDRGRGIYALPSPEELKHANLQGCQTGSPAQK